jgi:hypothetical protein
MDSEGGWNSTGAIYSAHTHCTLTIPNCTVAGHLLGISLYTLFCHTCTGGTDVHATAHTGMSCGEKVKNAEARAKQNCNSEAQRAKRERKKERLRKECKRERTDRCNNIFRRHGCHPRRPNHCRWQQNNRCAHTPMHIQLPRVTGRPHKICRVTPQHM